MNGSDLDLIVAWGHRIIGAVSGTAVALAFFWPRTAREITQIAIISPIVGILGAYPFREWMEWPSVAEYRLAAAGIIAVAAIPIITLAMRYFNRRMDE